MEMPPRWAERIESLILSVKRVTGNNYCSCEVSKLGNILTIYNLKGAIIAFSVISLFNSRHPLRLRPTQLFD